MQIYYTLTKEAAHAHYLATGSSRPYPIVIDLENADVPTELRQAVYLAWGYVKPTTVVALGQMPKLLRYTDRSLLHAITAETLNQAADLKRKMVEIIAGRNHMITQDEREFAVRLGEPVEAIGLNLATTNMADFPVVLAAYRTKRAEDEAAMEARRVDADMKAAEAHREREAAAKAARDEAARRDAVKASWIAANGSPHLRDAFAAGYDCQRMYQEERCNAEYTGADVDSSGKAEWTDRACPSPHALQLAEVINGQPIAYGLRPGDAVPPRKSSARVVWLKTGIDGQPTGGTEAIVVDSPNYTKHLVIVPGVAPHRTNLLQVPDLREFVTGALEHLRHLVTYCAEPQCASCVDAGGLIILGRKLAGDLAEASAD